tara:strand:- start:1173 stop:1451 length:279 start_codon:yes stop_codon:yes gene_type:complete
MENKMDLREEIKRLENLCEKNNIAYRKAAKKLTAKKAPAKARKEYSIEYALINGDVCEKIFKGENIEDALKNYNRTTCYPLSAVRGIKKIDY